MNTKPFTIALLLLANIVYFRGNAQVTNIFSTTPEDHARYVATLLNEQDRKQFEKILTKAETGDANSQCAIAEFYANGNLGVAQDIAEAVKWYRKSAQQNYTEAQFNLGWCFANGQGVKKDQTEAVSWWRKAAEQNDADAQLNLGWFYSHGLGVTKDQMEAVKWYRKAAEHGLAQAQFILGLHYYEGEGVEKDEVEAVRWYRKAAEANYAEAQFNLGCRYSEGKGVEKNMVEAARWYLKAADQNNTKAQYNLGNFYYNGDGVIKDRVEAYKWWLIAASKGDEDARCNLAISEKQLTPEQVEEGQKLARNFQPRKATANRSSDSLTSPENPTASGSGFFITDDGYLISNYHVVKGAAKVRLLTGAGLIDATVVKVDAANDLALLKTAGWFASLPIAASRTVKLGGTVATVGFPSTGMQGFSPKLAKGEIASLAGASDDPRYFQISLPVQHGNSGGALVDVRGNVVGIVAARLGVEIGKAVTSDELPENVNYAVKSSLLLSFLESVPDVASKIKEPNTKDEPFEDVVKSAQDAAVLVLVY